MEKLTCKNCGAPMVVNETKDFAECKNCGTKYKLNEDININIKLDDSMKETVNNGMDMVKKGSKLILIPFLIFFFAVALTIIIVVPKTISEAKKKSEETQEKFDIDSFNSKYEIRSGKKPKLFVETLIDDISVDNKKNKHKITLVYNDKEYTDSNDITDVKKELTKSEYEVSLDYDSKGYINKITIK